MAPTSAEEKKPRAIVVGAGLAGCLAGLVLAERGFDVDVFEYRSDPSTEAPGSQRSINLALSTRGLTALDLAGVGDEVRALGVPMHGRAVHDLSGLVQLQRYGQRGQHLLSVPRSALNKLLLDACARTGGVRVHFRHKCVSLDLAAGSVRLSTPDGEVKWAAELIVGADGAFSKVRAGFLRAGQFDFSQSYIPAAYKELALAPGAGELPAEWLHIWPRGRFMLIALPNGGGGFTCTLFMDRAEMEKLVDDRDIEAFFNTYFPDAARFMPDIAKDFKDAPTPSLVTVRVGPYHFRNRAVLVGDAAHAIVPFYGQGCNAAFEDCRVLGELLDRYGAGKLGMVLEEFSRVRKENADTIADLALDHYEDMASRSAKPGLVLLRKAGIWMNKLFPSYWLPLYSMVSFSNIPYKEAVRRADAQDRALTSAVAVGAGVVAVAAAVKAVTWTKRR